MTDLLTQLLEGAMAGVQAGTDTTQSGLYADTQSGAPVTDPYASATALPLLGADPNAYIGVPEGYEKLVGYRPSPTGQYGAHIRAGAAPDPIPIYNSPQYTGQMLANFTQLPKDQITSWQMRLYNMGFLDSSDMDGIGVMNGATHDAMQAAMGTANINGMTMDQLEKTIMAGRPIEKQMGFTDGSSSYGSGATNPYAPHTTTQTSTSVNSQENVQLTGRGGARAVLVSAMANEMGREPTANEVRRFLRSLHGAERRNPAESTTTTHATTTSTTDRSKSGDSTVTQDSKTKSNTTTKDSNVDPSQKAINYARDIGGKEAQSFQSSNFFSVIEQMVGL